ncbi:MAG TPA: FecR family protein [Terriglobales bacterium]|nr:FecR family protein [Terriglobales bacterium]
MIRGRKDCGVIACALLALSVLLATPVGASAARVEVRKMLDTSSLGDPFVFDVDPAGAVLVLTRDNIYDAGGENLLFGESLKDPGWLAFAGGKLQFLANGALFVVDGGKPRKLLDVPLSSRVFVPDGEQTYIGGITETGRAVLFLYKEGMGHKALLELDAPIDAMALARGKLFFTVGPRIYVLGEGGPAKLFAHLPGFPRIPSIAVDDKNGLLYFSDGENLYAVRGGGFVVVRRGVGGMLRCREGDLYVLSWRDHALFRMSGLSEAFSAAGALVPIEDPCKAPVLSLYCEAEKKRAVLKTLAALEGSMAPGDAAARDELDAYMAAQKTEFERTTAALEKEAATGTKGILWGGGVEPKAIGANAAIATEKKGVGITLWDGSGIRVGPDSKAVVGDCGPSRECRQTLEKGLLYFEAGKPPVEGMAGPTPREFVIATDALSLRFASARLAVFASGDQTAVVVLEGRVKAVTTRGESAIVTSGEMLDAQSGEPLGTPNTAEMERINRWWEEIR